MVKPRPAVLEVGPALLRRLDSGGAGGCDPAAAEAALEAADDPVALVGCPVPTGELWRTLAGDLLSGHEGPVLVVHPGWWPRARVDRVLDAVGDAAGGPVSAQRRAEFIAARVPGDPVVVEIGGDLVAAGAGDGAPEVLVCGRTEAIAATAAGLSARDGGEVLLDPAGAHGAVRCAAELASVLRRRGVGSRVIDLAAIADRDVRCDRRWRWRAGPRSVAVLAGALAAAALAAGLTRTAHLPVSPPAPTTGAHLTRGPVAATVPADWTVRAVNGGPGSPRVEVVSPTDPLAVLHITWAPAAGASPADLGAALGRAVASQPAGVFVDLRPDGRAAGRPAVTYAEVRPGRVIRWSVLLDGGTRIGVGCQSATDRPEAVAAACQQLLASARERRGAPG
jgi:type VII secretion-associated protein (TIGR03931 family)